MSSNPSSVPANLFYSYSHKDEQHRLSMETTLSLLKQKGLLRAWSDRNILPGTRISTALSENQPEADILAFLLSPDFLDSSECMKEWERAKRLAESGRPIFRVPIIVRDCSWPDFLGNDDVKALPIDGEPIMSRDDRDTAWREVYDGIKAIVQELRSTYTPRSTFREELTRTEIAGPTALSLGTVFIFPHLTKDDYTTKHDRLDVTTISDARELRKLSQAIIHGQERAGKTALAQHLVGSLLDDSQPALFLDFTMVLGRPKQKLLENLYRQQFYGDYDLWRQQQDKTLVIDNVTEAPGVIDFIVECSKTFTNIFLFVSSDIFTAFMLDDRRLAGFHQVRIHPFTRVQQEELIKKRLAIVDPDNDVTDVMVDRAETFVNDIIISNRIVPRYPFFILAILETFEQPVPTSISITSYSHCYFVFILSSLKRAGISESDEALNPALNFAEQLAYATFMTRTNGETDDLNFRAFKAAYQARYFIHNSVISRLTHAQHGIITSEGAFRTPYMYYYFLGRLFGARRDLAAKHLPDLCATSYRYANYLILLFTIHHAPESGIIEDIERMTRDEVRSVEVATLNPAETARYDRIIRELPESILSSKSVVEERARERKQWDDDESDGQEHDESEGSTGQMAVSMLRVLKNNKIMGQILRNQHGRLEKERVEAIVETITDSCLKLITLVLEDVDEIARLARRFGANRPQAEMHYIQMVLEWHSFLWTISSIEYAVDAVNVPIIKEAVQNVVSRNRTPAYDILGFFYQLVSTEQLTLTERTELAHLYREHRDAFVRKVLSIRTQLYMNTHHSDVRAEQSICALLEIEYKPRPRAISMRIR